MSEQNKSVKGVGVIPVFIKRILLSLFLLLTVFVVLFIVTGYFRAVKPGSFTPKTGRDDINGMAVEGNRLQIDKEWYSLILDPGGNIHIETPTGEKIISNLVYNDSYNDLDEKWGLDSISIMVYNDSSLVISGKGSACTSVVINITLPGDQPRIDFNIMTRYNNTVKVKRESFTASFSVDPYEIYLKNAGVHMGKSDIEYWLNREGIRFGSGNASALIYHPEKISSLQYRGIDNLLFINLDYYNDHPNISIPFQEDGGGRWIDISESEHEAGDVRESRFSIWLGRLPGIIPRLMPVPDGFLAGYIFTEHADGADMKLNRAVYFGSEKINDIGEASGGFAGYGIPVTKSVFYNDTKDCSVSRDSAFTSFLDQLHSTGLYDICLHTPEEGNSDREILKESISFMKNRYETRTWIDHGMYNGKNNRESFVCDGMDSLSVFYAADLWKVDSTWYFWNAGPEKIREVRLKELALSFKIRRISAEFWRRYFLRKVQKGEGFNGSMISDLKKPVAKFEQNSLMPLRGQSFPTPLYWQNPTKTGDFYSWVTDFVTDFSNLSGPGAEAELAIEKDLLDKLVIDRGVFINHGYFVRDRPGLEDGTVENINGIYQAGSYFNRYLEYMASLRDKGELNVTTVRDLLDYYTKLEKISFTYQQDGSVIVINTGDDTIPGLSMVAKAGSVTVNGELPRFKMAGDELVFWFDLPGRQKAVLNLR